MRFTKMHGCGNDYVYVDCFSQPEPIDPSTLAKRISDRHCGIGSDGLILILPSQVADARMRMFNADGSEGVMCGNGVRCVAKYLLDRKMVAGSVLRIETGRGVVIVEKVGDEFLVDMGEPILHAGRIPTTIEAKQVVNYAFGDHLDRSIAGFYHVAGFDLRGTCVSMGNAHLVFFGPAMDEAFVRQWGPDWETAEWFPDRINVHFAYVVTPREFSMRTWERGSGITLACGTGACAVAVAGVLTGRTNRKVLAHLPGGDLHLDWSESDNHVYMSGPAVEVFSGDWPD